MGMVREGKNTVGSFTRKDDLRQPRARDFLGAYKSIGAHNRT